MKNMPDVSHLAVACKALGDPTRLRILMHLHDCCSEVEIDANGTARATRGLTAGEVCCHVTGEERITSGISHHLKELRNAGLILMEKKGRTVVCSIDFDRVAALRAFVEALGPTENACAADC